jgi:predicted S18 family serine protease
MKQQKDHIGETNKMVEHHIVDTNKMITAVEWFYQRILSNDIKAVFEQAKAMEKEQIMNAYSNAFGEIGYTSFDKDGKIIWLDQSEEYYNETYNK